MEPCLRDGESRETPGSIGGVRMGRREKITARLVAETPRPEGMPQSTESL